MKVQGIEAVTLAKVVDVTARQDVRDTAKAAIDMNLGAGRGGKFSERDGLPQDARETEAVVERLNRAMDAISLRLKFELHDDSGKYYVRVVDELTDETIREIPSKRALDMLASMRQMVGVIIDERV